MRNLSNCCQQLLGLYAISPMNPDGSPNLAVFILGAAELEGKLYIRLNLAPRQSCRNILTAKQAASHVSQNPDT